MSMTKFELTVAIACHILYTDHIFHRKRKDIMENKLIANTSFKNLSSQAFMKRIVSYMQNNKK